jgi:hypothetical protein
MSNTSQQLCSYCDRIADKAEDLIDDWPNNRVYQREAEFHNLKSWKENALWCALCANLLHAAVPGVDWEDDASVSAEIMLMEACWCVLTLHSSSSRYGGDISRIDIRFLRGRSPSGQSGTLLDRYLKLRPLAEDNVGCYANLSSLQNWSSQSVDLVKRWLNTCSQHHSTCNVREYLNRSSSPTLPTRLIDTMPRDYSPDVNVDLSDLSLERSPYVKLCETARLPKGVRYMTLSHSWGQHPSVAWGRHPAITLTNRTKSEFYCQIPLANVTSPEGKVFKEATQVIRGLGFRYLWIDALCINQDDLLEKRAEIGIMDEIYSNSALNISATSSSSGAGGLFASRNVLSIEPYSYDTSFLYHGRETPGRMVFYDNQWEHDIDEGPLNKRAWVLQERTLAPSVLHFTREQVYWECAMLRASETFPNGVLEEFTAQTLNMNHWYRLIASDESLSLDSLAELWSALVGAYTRCNLTFATDKLVAISGIARRITRLTHVQPNDYVAGLWRPLILYELLWNVRLEIAGDSHGDACHAPSWSWASTNAPVGLGSIHQLKELSPAVEVLEARVNLTNDNIFGQVTGGHLRLRGPLCRASCVKDSQTGALSVDINGTLYSRGLLLTKWDTIPAKGLSGASHQSEGNFLDESSEFAQNPVYFMIFWGYPDYVDENISRQGLILVPTGSRKGQYRRIGTFWRWEDAYANEPSINSAFQSKTLEAETYIEWDGEDRYTVEVV